MEWLFNELKQYVGSIGDLIFLALLVPFAWAMQAWIQREGWTAILHFPGRVFQLVRALLQQVRRPGRPQPLRPETVVPDAPSLAFPSSATLESMRMVTSDPARVFTNSIGMRFRWISPGQFQMGSPEYELGRCSSDERLHSVQISEGFWLGMHPVTQEQFRAVMSRNPATARVDGENRPVETVTWDEAIEFCRRLSSTGGEHMHGRTYRLPTEAEWEYACRAGTTTAFHFGSTLTPTKGNFGGTRLNCHQFPGMYRGRITAVGEYPANEWDLYDMHANVWEWCSDYYAPNYGVSDITRESIDPEGPDCGEERVIKGGCWSSPDACDCRSARRRKRRGNEANDRIGFRVVCVLPCKVDSAPARA